MTPINFPHYLTDLNAMHTAVETLTQSQRAMYAKHLMDVCGEYPVGPASTGDYHSDLRSVTNITQATAAQRAEAFLRTTRP